MSTLLYSVHSLVESPQLCTVSTVLYSIHGSVQCPQSCTVSTVLYSVHSFVQSPEFCTVSTVLYSVYRSVQFPKCTTESTSTDLYSDNERPVSDSSRASCSQQVEGAVEKFRASNDSVDDLLPFILVAEVQIQPNENHQFKKIWKGSRIAWLVGCLLYNQI